MLEVVTREHIERVKARMAGGKIGKRAKKHLMRLRHAMLSAELDVIRAEAMARRPLTWETV